MKLELNSPLATKILTQIIERTVELFVIVDSAGQIAFVNPAFSDLSGYSEDEVLGRRPYDFIALPEDTQFLRVALSELNTNGVWRGRLALSPKSGESVEVYLDVFVCKDELTQMDYYVAIGHHLRREQDLQHQMEEVQRLESVGSLANGVSHHFNNILASIAGQVELLMALEKDSKAVLERGQKILDASKRGQEVVEQLMTFCRKTKPEQKRIDIAPIVRNATKMVEQFYLSGVAFSADIPEKAPAILGIAEDINQIVVNLLTNAIEAVNSSNKGGKVSIRLTEAGRSLGKRPDGKPLDPVRCLKLTVSDSGIGMDETTRKQLFDPFFTTKNRSESSGMGLTVTHSLIKRHRGVVSVLSTPNEGSTFEVYLPILPNEAIVLSTERIDILGQGEQILFYDTETFVRDAGAKLLQDMGYSVCAPDDLSRVENIESFNLAIIGVSDLEVESLQYVNAFCAEYNTLPVLLAYPARLGGVLESIKKSSRATDFLPKPCPVDELVSKVQGLLGGKKKT